MKGSYGSCHFPAELSGKPSREVMWPGCLTMHQTSQSTPKQPMGFCSNLMGIRYQGFFQVLSRNILCDRTHLVTEGAPLTSIPEDWFSPRGSQSTTGPSCWASEPTCASAPLPGQTHVLIELSWGGLISLGWTPEPYDLYLEWPGSGPESSRVYM